MDGWMDRAMIIIAAISPSEEGGERGDETYTIYIYVLFFIRGGGWVMLLSIMCVTCPPLPP